MRNAYHALYWILFRFCKISLSTEYKYLSKYILIFGFDYCNIWHSYLAKSEFSFSIKSEHNQIVISIAISLIEIKPKYLYLIIYPGKLPYIYTNLLIYTFKYSTFRLDLIQVIWPLRYTIKIIISKQFSTFRVTI